MGNRRDCFHYTLLTAYDNEGLCFLKLTLGVKFLDLVRTVSFVFSSGMPVAPMVKP